MLSGLVQGLDLADEEHLVAAGHGHAQDQLKEAGDVVEPDVLFRLGGEVWDGKVAGNTVLSEVVGVVVEQHVQQSVQPLQRRLLRLQ